ncbi:MAG: hypothetical protein O7H41_12975 [Planctomycetota bacterium]|nr:hypothetical protein [Planctomycetota bacterium]
MNVTRVEIIGAPEMGVGKNRQSARAEKATPTRGEPRERRVMMGTKPDFSNLDACIDDAKRATLDGATGPDDPIRYHELLGRLEAAKSKLPPLYVETVFKPYVSTLNAVGQDLFNLILLRDPERESTGGLMLDIAHAILQNGEGFEPRATDAFQEVVSDLFDGFLSAEDRHGVKPPDKGVVAPLVKWGNPSFGPYTWTVAATEAFRVGASIVSLPPSLARKGLVAWGTLGHETGGHDILQADTGLQAEMAEKVHKALRKAKFKQPLAKYWADRISETASDVLGILNMGPAAAIGIIAYFRGLRDAISGEPKLSNFGPSGGVHPADILRGYLGASTVRHLSFSGAADWAEALTAETDKDLSTIILARRKTTAEDARGSAAVVAETLVHEPMDALESHSLGSIQDWRDEDEEIVSTLRTVLTSAVDLPNEIVPGTFAAHAVAAAIVAALADGGDIPIVFDRMLSVLKTMHDENPSWGPLFVSQPGNIYMRRAYESVS